MKKIAAILLAVLSVFALTSCRVGDKIKVNFYAPYWNFWKYSSGSEFTYTAADIKEIDINWVGGEIEIVSSKNAELTVTENSEELDEGAKMHYFIKDGKLILHYSEAFYKEETDASHKHVRIEVPEGIEIDVDSVTASVKIGEMALGAIKITNVSGDVQLARLAASEVEIENVDGNIVAGEIVADEFSVESVSGSLTFSGVSANEIKVNTVSGKTELGVNKRAEVEISSVSGGIELFIPDDIGATVEYSTMSGHFISEKPHTTSKKTYIFGKGEIHVTVETMSGNLHVS